MGFGLSRQMRIVIGGGPRHSAVVDPGAAALAEFDVDLVGSDLADGATGDWVSRNGGPTFLLGGTSGDDGADEPAVAGGVLTFAGGSEYVLGPTAARPALGTGDGFTALMDITPDLTGETIQYPLSISNNGSLSLTGIMVSVVTSTSLVRVRMGDGTNAGSVQVSAVAERSLIAVTVDTARGADGLRVRQYRTATGPSEQSASTASVGDATPGVDPSIGRISGGIVNNYEGDIRRVAYTGSRVADGDLDAIATHLGFQVTA